ncbi:MAG: serine/threonine-protein kinase [Gemmataceae bacterium]
MAHDKIGPFTILGELGTGAGSQVFRIRRHADRAEFALKLVYAETRLHLKYLEQLQHEYDIGQFLKHPNIIRMYALEMESDWLFRPKKGQLLLEFAPGRAPDRFPRLSPDRLVHIFMQVASALAHMHSKGIYHADLKPDNLILGPRDTVKVIDFGLAGFEGEMETRVHGTPEYMAPETKLRKVIDARTELYNFGATMYRLATLRHLPQSVPGVALNQRTHSRLVIPVAKLNDEIPEELCELIHWCIRYEPEARPQQVSDVQEILHHLARQCGEA